MQNIKILFSIIIIVLSMLNMDAQAVNKKIIVEHFTNSRCGVCANRNPGFYNALNQKPDVLHIAYHPSSPYNNCLFSTQNKTENDARTNFYGLYGGTPTFAINGEVKTANQVQSSGVYTPYENKTSALSVDVVVIPAGADSIKVSVTITAVATHTFNTLTLYVPLAEDTVFYTSPNGEIRHYDVFRKSFTGSNPITFPAPATIGSIYSYSSKLAKNNLWNPDRLYAMAIVQHADKTIVQAEDSPLFDENATSSTDVGSIDNTSFDISPNPGNSLIHIHSKDMDAFYDISFLDLAGTLILKQNVLTGGNSMDISSLKPG
ncbi:MAG: hypothetical protein H7X99_02685, partial [Saprospiraceae bacterium]|nr:hypothetical protein [Saprospiraceae bacterium]